VVGESKKQTGNQNAGDKAKDAAGSAGDAAKDAGETLGRWTGPITVSEMQTVLDIQFLAVTILCCR
jgi:hypothetical protein